MRHADHMYTGIDPSGIGRRSNWHREGDDASLSPRRRIGPRPNRQPCVKLLSWSPEIRKRTQTVALRSVGVVDERLHQLMSGSDELPTSRRRRRERCWTEAATPCVEPKGSCRIPRSTSATRSAQGRRRFARHQQPERHDQDGATVPWGRWLTSRDSGRDVGGSTMLDIRTRFDQEPSPDQGGPE